MIFNNTEVIEIVTIDKLNERQKSILSHLQFAKSSVSQIADLMNADEIDERKIVINFNMDILEILNSVPTFFSESELQYLG